MRATEQASGSGLRARGKHGAGAGTSSVLAVCDVSAVGMPRKTGKMARVRVPLGAQHSWSVLSW